MIYGEFGHLGDIPHDLANTIANIYYEFIKIDNDIQNTMKKAEFKES